jgi:hypothetical protein
LLEGGPMGRRLISADRRSRDEEHAANIACQPHVLIGEQSI